MTVLLIGLLSCQNQKPAENGSFTTASYNLRYANAEDSAAGNGWGKRYPVQSSIKATISAAGTSFAAFIAP